MAKFFRASSISRVVTSGLFDPEHYEQHSALAGASPARLVRHYLQVGWREGLDPSPEFSTRFYLQRYPDVAHANINPLLHFLDFGQLEARPVVRADGYLQTVSVSKYAGFSWAQGFWVLLRYLAKNPSRLRSLFLGVCQKGLSQAVFVACQDLRRRKLQWPLADSPSVSQVAAPAAPALPPPSCWTEMPWFPDPYGQLDFGPWPQGLAVHIHLQHPSRLGRWLDFVAKWPTQVSLYLTTPTGPLSEQINTLPANIQLQTCTESTVSPFASFVKTLPGSKQTELMWLHIHDQIDFNSEHTFQVVHDMWSTLCGDLVCVRQMLHLLETTASTLLLRPPQSKSHPPRFIAQSALPHQAWLSPPTQPDPDQTGLMFWASDKALASLSNLAESGELAGPESWLRALRQQFPATTYTLQTWGEQSKPGPVFERPIDFSHRVRETDIKVLAYYLPQFHPTPENDEWHGKGFTEWYKVRSAQPQFLGHYQPHIPHPDTGYYQLDGPEVLRKQWAQMRCAGVHGLIFYHYWFSGRMILEEPAKILLGTTDIKMPFCFCWANENWTRRWDGNEREVLLGQEYSPQDARAFMEYLIPFFRDSRYIRIDDRPVLYVYRPSSMPDSRQYLAIWREVCAEQGLPPPYVIATLTRGALSAEEFGMDAAQERVLHDWTDGAVPASNPSLGAYRAIAHPVLDYSAVVDHYICTPRPAGDMIFRSLVPVWDNTPRYGSQAHIVHGFSLPQMQRWLEHLIHDARQHLPADRRFIVVNAWNEWAEGAHLEPDTAQGYGYLNTVGRALGGIPYSSSAPEIDLPPCLKVHIQLGPVALQRLQTEPVSARKFHQLFRTSMAAVHAEWSTNHAELRSVHDSLRSLSASESDDNPCWRLQIDDLCLLTPEALVRMLRMGHRHDGVAVAANLRNVDTPLEGPPATDVVLYPPEPAIWLRICAQAAASRIGAQTGPAESAPRVRTIVRYHAAGCPEQLLSALHSLLAQEGCNVQPILTLQDIPEAQLHDLQNQINPLPWGPECEPVWLQYTSSAATPDLRSKMLNEGLRKAATGYAACLDHDDIIFNDAYAWMVARLQETGKNATFGRVYVANLDSDNFLLSRQRRFERGLVYADYYDNNHAPLHSFMFNLDRFSIKQTFYFDDMKYMEDYYLTLQIFSPEGTDWNALACNRYVGDYNHRLGGYGHTLALTNESQLKNLLEQKDYMRCDQRINDLRHQIRQSWA
ncbi:MAG: glycoside hydrolase family 99-like domain-containing protein [Burkholderiales bacterium]